MTRPTALAIVEDDLPPSAKDLVRWVGWRGALAIIQHMPGVRIYSPMRGPHWSPRADARYAQVAELVGERAARDFYEVIAGTFFEVPVCYQAILRARNRALRQAYDAGATIEQLCATFGRGRRMVQYILKMDDAAAPGAPRRQMTARGQLGLF